MQKFPFHLVDFSALPFFSALGAFSMTFGGVSYFHGYEGGFFALSLGFSIVLYGMFLWWRDIIREATYEGFHTIAVQDGMKSGMILFVVSEVMFFFGFFWSFFHSSLAPTVDIGCAWIPEGITPLNAFEIPFLNTLILLSSGVTLTWSHYSLMQGYKKQAIIGLILTIVLGLCFTSFQVLEYLEASFSINDSSYGSVFFMATGFHGFHILIGTIFLIVCLFRMYEFNKFHQFGFEAGSLYWHFVDVVWLFLFACIYYWGA